MPRHLFAAVLFCLGLAAPAGAATLGVVPNPAVGFSLGGAVEISDDAGGLVVNNAAGASLAAFGVPGLTDNAFDLLVVGDGLGGVAPTASLFIDGADGSIEGDLVRFLVSASSVALLFDVVSDDFGVFGGQVLLLVTDDFSAGVFSTGASATINPVAPIPLPAGLPLLATGLAVIVAAARRRPA